MKEEVTFEQRHPWIVEDMLGSHPPVRFTNARCAAKTVLFNDRKDKRKGKRSEWRAFHAERLECLSVVDCLLLL